MYPSRRECYMKTLSLFLRVPAFVGAVCLSVCIYFTGSGSGGAADTATAPVLVAASNPIHPLDSGARPSEPSGGTVTAAAKQQVMAPVPKQAAPEGDSAVAPAAAARNTPSDQDLMQAVVTQVLRSPDPSILKRVKFQARNGRVTLRGTLKTERQRKEIIALVERAVGAERVDDELNLPVKK